MFIHCKTRPNATPPSEEIYLNDASIFRADPETDAAGSFVRITPCDPDRPSFGILPCSGPTDAITVLVWWWLVVAQCGEADGHKP